MRTRLDREGAGVRRRIAIVLAIAMVATLVPTLPVRADNLLSFPDGSQQAVFGPNAMIRIDGRILYETECDDPGIPDFFYPATDVYLVEEVPGDGDALEDVNPFGVPNTIIATTTVFISEVLGATEPGGFLPEGTYHVVYDTCQDGSFDASQDSVFADAITVDLPLVLPPADAAIAEMKVDALIDWGTWIATRYALQKIFDQTDKAVGAACSAGNGVACAYSKLDPMGGIKDQTMALLLSQANHYKAIAADPPDPDFEQYASVTPEATAAERASGPTAAAAADAGPALAVESALAEAFLHAIERYQGAQAAGDGYWALVHAREAADLVGALAVQGPVTDAALADVRAGVADERDAIEGMVDVATDWAWGLHQSSLTPDERRVLRNRDLSPSDIVALEAEGRGTLFGLDEFARIDADDLLDELDELLATRDGFVAAASSVAEEWSVLADEVAALDGMDELAPTASAGGPYTVDAGAELTLDASASAPAPGADGLAEVAWDADGDGEFDDAEGASPTVSLERPGSHVVGVRVVDDAGGEAVSHAVVQVEAAHAPTIATATPAGRLAEVTVGAPETFEVDVIAGGPVDTVWTLDGEQVGTGPAFAYDPADSDVGFHELRATVTDAAGQSTHHAWDVAVELPDADGDGWTATTDCDDEDPAVHPGALERPGNGVDDDCDDGTPDAPPGGLTGTVRTWGAMYLGGLGIGPTSSNANTPQTPEVEEAVQVETGFRSGYALLPSGEVRAWGSNFNGQIGDGSTTHRSTPQTVLGVDGASPALTGVLEISASHRSQVLARRADGTVVGWGDGRSGVLADASNPAARPYPTVQRLEDDTPLDGVVAVKANSVSSFAITDDGRLWSWGVQYCRGGRSGQSVPVSAIPSPLTDPDVFDVRQVDAHQAFTLILRHDGTVLSCGAGGSQAGRPVTIDEPAFNPSQMTDFGPGSGVVEVATGSGFALALKDDGSVWAWGVNINDQLSAFGLAAGAAWEEPRELDLPEGPPVIDIEVGTCHSMLRRADGSALQFGCNWLGQSATGDFLEPAEVHEVLPDDPVIDSHLSPWNTIALSIPRSTEDGDWDWPVGYASASVSGVEVVEGGTGTVTVTLDQELPSDVSIDWAVLGGSATEEDLPLTSDTVTIPAGSTEATIEVATLDDDIDEPDEHFTVALTSATNGLRIDRAQGTGTLVDDDEAPAVSLESVEIDEGDTSLTDAVVPVELSHPSSEPVEVSLGSVDGSAVTPDDYAALSTTVTFEPGETSAEAHVAVRGDLELEPDETFEVVARDGDGSTLDTATVTVIDDESLALSTERVVAVDEGTGGTTVVSLPVAVDPAPLSAESVTIGYEVVGDTAEVPADAEGASGTVELTADAPEATVEIAVVADDVPEDDEVFRVVFDDPAASDGRPVLPTGTATVVIRDDDLVGSPPTVVLDEPFAGEEGSPIDVSAAVEDPDGPGSVEWSADRSDCVFADAVEASTTLTCADDGSVEVMLTADDGVWPAASATGTVEVANVAPSVSLDVDQAEVEPGDTITATATARDPGADDLTFTWSDGEVDEVAAADGAPTAATRSHAFVADDSGPFEVSVEVADDDGASERVSVTVGVGFPNAPPSCETVRAEPALLWSPDHKFREVTVLGGSDPDADPLILEITSVTQDEPVNGLGDGDTAPDARRGDRAAEVDLRAERAGNGDGRIYRLGVTVNDGNGGACETTVHVGVPKAQGGRHATPVESPLSADSFTSP